MSDRDLLRSDASVHALDGAVAVRTADGRLVRFPSGDPHGLAQALRAGEPPPDMADGLRRHGLLGQADLLAGLARPSLPPRRGKVVVRGGGAAADAALATLRPLGVDCANGGEARAGEDLLLLALDSWDLAAIEACNAEAAAAGQPWLAASPTEARRIQVGPLVVPGQTACYTCYVSRRTANAWQPPAFEAHLQDLRAGRAPPLLGAPWPQLAGQLGAWEAARFQRGLPCATLGAAVSLGADSLDAAHDAVPKAPRCAVCTRHGARPPAEPWLPVPVPEASASKPS